MPLVFLRLFRKNLGNLRDFSGQLVYRPSPRPPPPAPWQKISRTPMVKLVYFFHPASLVISLVIICLGRIRSSFFVRLSVRLKAAITSSSLLALSLVNGEVVDFNLFSSGETSVELLDEILLLDFLFGVT